MFYKLDENELLCGPSVEMPKGIKLDESNYLKQTYPIDGWYYFNSLEDALNFFGLVTVEVVEKKVYDEKAIPLLKESVINIEVIESEILDVKR